jgi:hypothetical protein
MKYTIRLSVSLLAFCVLASFWLLRPPAALSWGEHGHRISGRAAATNLPQEMPAFFRTATAQLEYLNPEPDRWRERSLSEMNEAFRYDHYIDLEVVPAPALNAHDRYTYLGQLYKAGVKEPAKDAGLLPFHILEMYQRMLTEFRLWRRTSEPQTRQWIEQRIINDAGLLGHYVTDGANPHHTTVHHNGWASGYPNPNGYTTDNTFHTRFETQYVESHINVGDLIPQLSPAPRLLADTRGEVLKYLQSSNALVERLYRLDKEQKFDNHTTSESHKSFAVERLVAGASMLRNLWWTAWTKSADGGQVSPPEASPSKPTLPSRTPAATSRTTAPEPQAQPKRLPPAGATAECNDGTYSFSSSRRGTCSHHGGVKRWL